MEKPLSLENSFFNGSRTTGLYYLSHIYNVICHITDKLLYVTGKTAFRKRKSFRKQMKCKRQQSLTDRTEQVSAPDQIGAQKIMCVHGYVSVYLYE